MPSRLVQKKTPDESGALNLNTYYLYMKTKRLYKFIMLNYFSPK